MAGTRVGKSATWLWACLLRTALLSLGLSQSFTISCLNTKALTKVLLSIDGCQIIVAVAGIQARDVLFGYLADVTP